MSINKKIIIASIGAVLLILLIVAAVMLFTGIRQFGVAETNLAAARSSLDSFYRRDPFPSSDNVKVVRQNIRTLEEWSRDIGDFAKKNQIEPDSTRSPSAFVNMLSQVRNDLHSKAKREGVLLDAEFGFGFGPYYAGQPATAEFVPRLIQQLVIIASVCDVLIDNKVREIASIERELFDGVSSAAPAAMPAGPRGGARRPRVAAAGQAATSPGLMRVSLMPPPSPEKDAGEFVDDETLGKMRFVFEFTARESSLISILNRLATSDMFVVVTSVDVEVQEVAEQKTAAEVPSVRGRAAVVSMPFGQSDDAEAGEAEKKIPARPKLIPSRSERVVFGGKLEAPAKVRLELEVYRFK